LITMLKGIDKDKPISVPGPKTGLQKLLAENKRNTSQNRRMKLAINMVLNEREVIFDPQLTNANELKARKKREAEELKAKKLKAVPLIKTPKRKRKVKKKMNSTEEKARRILNGMQLGTYYTVKVGNYRNSSTNLRVPNDIQLDLDDIVLFAVAEKGDDIPGSHSNTADEHIFDYGQVLEIHRTPKTDTQSWIVQKVDLGPWEQRLDDERAALEKIGSMEAQREHQNIMEQYGDSLPDSLKGDFEALQGRFRPSSALPNLSEANDEKADGAAIDVDLDNSESTDESK